VIAADTARLRATFSEGRVVLDRSAIATEKLVVQGGRKSRVMIWADPGRSLLPLTTGDWSI